MAGSENDIELYEGYCAAIVRKWIPIGWGVTRARGREQIDVQCRRTVKGGCQYCFAHEPRPAPSSSRADGGQEA